MTSTPEDSASEILDLLSSTGRSQYQPYATTMSLSRPPPIQAYEEGTFAHFTIQRRLPQILAAVKVQFDDRDRDDPRWLALESGIRRGSEIDMSLFLPDTAFWRRKVAKLVGTRWSAQAFFDLEFLFYQAIHSIARDLRPGFDVFTSARRTALYEALPRVARVVESTHPLAFEDALLLAMSANEADLSQLAQEGLGSTPLSMLKDERGRIAEGLEADNGEGTVQLLADNAGSEICFDLVLVDWLLGMRSGPVEMQLKSQPMFVSDALISDVEETIAGFCKQDTGSRLARMGARLRQALHDGRLVLRAPNDWAEPRHMNALDAELAACLQAASLVISKGDLHYRRFFEDRTWPADSPVSVASVATGMRAFALRVLKSDCVVGLEPAAVSRLFAIDPDWRSNAKYSVVQRVDQGAGP